MVSSTQRAAKPLVNRTVVRQFARELRKLGTRGRQQYTSDSSGYNNHQRSWRYLIAQGDTKTEWLWTPQGILLDLVTDEWRQGRASTKHSERYYYFPYVKQGREYVDVTVEDLIPPGVAQQLRNMAQAGASGAQLAEYVESRGNEIVEYCKDHGPGTSYNRHSQR